MSMFKSFLNDESGATAIEYGIIAAVVAVGLIASLGTLKNNMGTAFNNIGNSMINAS